jgi:predicted N-acetyltransferase YhbS
MDPRKGQEAMVTIPEPGTTGPRLDAGVPDYSDSNGDDFEALSRDRIPVRSLREDDLDAIVGLDAKLTGHDRRAYFEAKLREVMSETGVRISLVAEVDGRVAGFIMARVDYGEFGQTESAAVIDTLGVEPAQGHHGVGTALLSQLLANLHVLHVERVRTRVTWNNFQLLGFLGRNGFVPAQQLVLTKPIDPA